MNENIRRVFDYKHNKSLASDYTRRFITVTKKE